MLRKIVPRHGSRLLYVDHVVGRGEDLFKLVCASDLFAGFSGLNPENGLRFGLRRFGRVLDVCLKGGRNYFIFINLAEREGFNLRLVSLIQRNQRVSH